MKNSVLVPTYSRSLWIGLIFVLLLTACSGNQPNPNSALLAQEVAQGAQNEIPKADSQANVQAPAVAKVVDGGQLQAQTEPAQPQAQSPAQLLAAAGAAPAASLPDAARPAPAIDLSLPVEPRVGARAPEISLQTLDGQMVNLSGLVGSPVVISYWSTWCIPCKQELPILQKLAQEYAAQGLVVLTVNATDQDDVAKVQEMVNELGMTFPVLLDDAKTFASNYQAMFFPSTFFVDASGVIRDIRLGDSTEADLRTKIENLLAAN